MLLLKLNSLPESDRSEVVVPECLLEMFPTQCIQCIASYIRSIILIILILSIIFNLSDRPFVAAFDFIFSFSSSIN